MIFIIYIYIIILVICSIHGNICYSYIYNKISVINVIFFYSYENYWENFKMISKNYYLKYIFYQQVSLLQSFYSTFST